MRTLNAPVIGLAVLLPCMAASRAQAGAIFTDQGQWLAALGGKPVNSLALTPQLVPDTGLTLVDEELTVHFPVNHGGMEVYSTGWMGDVHPVGDPEFHEPGPTIANFNAPISALGAWVSIGPDADPEFESILFTLVDDHRLWALDYAEPHFFGWIGQPTDTLTISSGGGWHYYEITEVQYVVALPEPAASAGGVLLLGALGLRRRTC